MMLDLRYNWDDASWEALIFDWHRLVHLGYWMHILSSVGSVEARGR